MHLDSQAVHHMPHDLGLTIVGLWLCQSPGGLHSQEASDDSATCEGPHTQRLMAYLTEQSDNQGTNENLPVDRDHFMRSAGPVRL